MNATADAFELASDRPAPGLLGWAERGWIPDGLLRLGLPAGRFHQELFEMR